MPRRDGTGPENLGPLTGRGLGNCQPGSTDESTFGRKFFGRGAYGGNGGHSYGGRGHNYSHGRGYGWMYPYFNWGYWFPYDYDYNYDSSYDTTMNNTDYWRPCKNGILCPPHLSCNNPKCK